MTKCICSENAAKDCLSYEDFIIQFEKLKANCPIRCKEKNKIINLDIEQALSLLEEYIDNVGGCDHSVGLCVCGDKRVLQDAKKANRY